MKKLLLMVVVLVLNINILLSVDNNYETISWETYTSTFSDYPILEAGDDVIIIEVDGRKIKVRLPK